VSHASETATPTSVRRNTTLKDRVAARMNNKEIPKHYHHFEGSMRENVDELLAKHKDSIDTQKKIAKVFYLVTFV
jgi:hypothetical protein